MELHRQWLGTFISTSSAAQNQDHSVPWWPTMRYLTCLSGHWSGNIEPWMLRPWSENLLINWSRVSCSSLVLSNRPCSTTYLCQVCSIHYCQYAEWLLCSFPYNFNIPYITHRTSSAHSTVTSSLIILALLFKNVMPLALNSVRTTSHVSVLRNATPLFIGASRLHRTTLFQQSLRVFPKFIQKAVSKAMTPVVAPKAVPPVFVSKLIDAETRQRHRIKRMAAQRIYQQNARRPAAKIYNAGPFLYYGHTGSNYYDYDPGKSNSNPFSQILRACIQGFWLAFWLGGFDSFSDVVHGR